MRPFKYLENKNLWNILKSFICIYESSGSQFFRTIAGICSGPDSFNESRFIMTFLTICGVTEILHSFCSRKENNQSYQD